MPMPLAHSLSQCNDHQPIDISPLPDYRAEDLPEDSKAWSFLLAAAFELDGDNPTGLCGSLHGFRCLGARLTTTDRGVRIEQGELGVAYAELRERYLVPHTDGLTTLLSQLSAKLRGFAVTYE
jgi:hypothetical protein